MNKSCKKFKHTIEMYNETELADLFERYRSDLYDCIMQIMDESFLFDLDLVVIIRELDEKVNFVNKETDDAATTIKDKKFTVIFNIDSLKRIPYDKGLDIAISIHHELAHVRDLYYTMHNKYYKINPLKTNHKSFDDFVISKGALFWTEFYAYYITFRFFKYQHGYPTFLQLIKAYERLQDQFEDIKTIRDFKSSVNKQTIENFINDIEKFAYAAAKHLAGSINGRPYNYEYCEKTQNRESFDIVEKLNYGLIKKIQPLFKNTYGKGMANKMYDLGKYLIKNLFIKFDIYPIKYKRYIRFAYYS